MLSFWIAIQDDLALFFVDMRSTLLVRMAAAGPIMDELCLRTETFEKAIVYAPPGELIVCAPQVKRPFNMMWRREEEGLAWIQQELGDGGEIRNGMAYGGGEESMVNRMIYS